MARSTEAISAAQPRHTIPGLPKSAIHATLKSRALCDRREISIGSVGNKLPYIRYSHTSQHSHRRYFKERAGLVLPPVAPIRCPDHQTPGKNAEGDAVQNGRNWIPSFAPNHWSV